MTPSCRPSKLCEKPPYGASESRVLRVAAGALSVGGQCSGAEYIGMTCSDYKQTSIDMVATMSTCERASERARLRLNSEAVISPTDWLLLDWARVADTHDLPSFKKDIASVSATKCHLLQIPASVETVSPV
jgi:hypothetical protein